MTPDFQRALLVGGIVGVLGAVLTRELWGFVYAAAGGLAVATTVLVIEGAVRRWFRRPGVQPLPSFGFVAWGFLPTYQAVASLGRGPVDGFELALGAFSLAWWVVGILLIRGVRGALTAALALIAVPWSLVVTQTVWRVEFIIREGGMERADGLGSPLAFLTGWIVELSFVFIPLTIIAARVGWELWRGRFRRDDTALLSAHPRSSR